MRVLILLAALAAAASASPAIAQDGVCKATSDAITDALKAVSLLTMEDVTDDSAPRATMRAARKGSAYQEINQNLEQLRQHNCPAFPYPISDKIYQSPAAVCSLRLATMRLQTGYASEGDVPECNRTTWQPAPAKGS